IVSMAINTELRDPRVGMVTVTEVGLSADLRRAVVKISVMGDETKAKLTIGGLRSAAGFLQSKIAKGLDMRYTPKLSFEIDEGVKKQLAMAALLREVLPDTNPTPGDGPVDAETPDDSTALAEIDDESPAHSQSEPDAGDSESRDP
ncbi:MAG TPA: 30S ribosome-binding factor RbfA, partial [Pirellulales bacterium]